MWKFWGVPRNYSLDKHQWSSSGQAELGKGTRSFGICWFHLELRNFLAPSISEGGVPKGKVRDLFEKSGKMEQPHSQDAPEALILSGSARQEFPDLFSMWEWIFRGVVIYSSGQPQPPRSHQNFTYRQKNLEAQAEFLHFFGFWELWNSLFSTLF